MSCIVGIYDSPSFYSYRGSQLNVFFNLREDFRFRLTCKDFEQETVNDYGVWSVAMNTPKSWSSGGDFGSWALSREGLCLERKNKRKTLGDGLNIFVIV